MKKTLAKFSMKFCAISIVAMGHTGAHAALQKPVEEYTRIGSLLTCNASQFSEAPPKDFSNYLMAASLVGVVLYNFQAKKEAPTEEQEPEIIEKAYYVITKGYKDTFGFMGFLTYFLTSKEERQKNKTKLATTLSYFDDERAIVEESGVDAYIDQFQKTYQILLEGGSF